MFEQIGAFFASVVHAEFTFESIGEFFRSTFGAMAQSPSVSYIWNGITSALSGISAVVPFIIILLSIVEILCGKRILNFQKFLFCVLIGYCVGATYISPLINQIFTLPDYISGAVIAIVAAVLCKFIYVLFYVLAAGYTGYLLSFSGLYIEFLAPITKGNYFIAIVIAAAFIVLALVLRKYLEMFGTSVLGGYFLSKSIIALFDYRALGFLGEFGWVAELVLILLVGVLGFIFQYKTRVRY